MKVSEVKIRQLNYSDPKEAYEFYKLFWAVPVELGDEYITEKSQDFIEQWVDNAIASENDTNTFSGIVLLRGQIIGVHVLRRFDEFEETGVHIASLWVEKHYRGKGIGKELKNRGEVWAHSIGATFINTNVLPGNNRMLNINKSYGFSTYKINMRKRLTSQHST